MAQDKNHKKANANKHAESPEQAERRERSAPGQEHPKEGMARRFFEKLDAALLCRADPEVSAFVAVSPQALLHAEGPRPPRSHPRPPKSGTHPTGVARRSTGLLGAAPARRLHGVSVIYRSVPMLKKIGIGVAAALLVLIIVIATRPSTFHYERSTTVAAPPAAVYALVSDFHQWAKWSPWDKLDPNMKRTYSGTPATVGAKYEWVGNDDVGEGRMTIEEAKPNELVRTKLEFIKPWEATNTSTFTLKPEASGTKVTWSMDGPNNFMSKAFGLFMDMEGMIGKDFEKGLADIKKNAEADAAQRPQGAAAPPAAPAPPAGETK